MPSDAFLEFLDDNIVTGVEIESEGMFELYVESEGTVVEVEATEYLEFFERGPQGETGSSGVIVLEAGAPAPSSPITGVLYLRKLS